MILGRDTGVVEETAPAKLNLTLHVVGQRADGYHLLDGLTAFTDIADTVTAAPAEDLSLTVAGPGAPALTHAADNLVLRAARALATATGVPARAHLTLNKQLPVASGIGGGSTDAAATLRALQRLWRVQAPDPLALALSLGADVPVCLRPRPQWLGGVGEALAPAPPLPPLAVVLANSGEPLATPAVFKAREGRFSAPCHRQDLRPPVTLDGLLAWLAVHGNDLEAPAERLCPVIATVRATLAAQPGCALARMSGSGATVVGLFAEATAARAAAMALGQAHPRWWVRAGALIS